MERYNEMDFRAMFEAYGFELPNGNSGLVMCNQGAHENKTMSVTVNKGIFNCFSCGYHGSIAKVYKEMFHKWYGRPESLSADELNSYFKARQNIKVVKEVPKEFKMTPIPYESPSYTNWLAYRGISKDVADKAGAFYGGCKIQYIDDYGENKEYKVMDRVMFPIYNKDKKLVSLEMRFPFNGTESQRFKDNVKKVLYPKRSSTNLLYEEYDLNRATKLYLLEGMMDCLAFRSMTGKANTTTCFGALITNHQKELLNEFPELCYVFNNDEAGLASLESVRQFYKGKLTILKPAGNFNDVGEMAIAKFTEVEEWLKTEH